MLKCTFCVQKRLIERGDSLACVYEERLRQVVFYSQILLPGPVHTQSICHSFSMGSRLPFDLPLISCNDEVPERAKRFSPFLSCLCFFTLHAFQLENCKCNPMVFLASTDVFFIAQSMSITWQSANTAMHGSDGKFPHWDADF